MPFHTRLTPLAIIVALFGSHCAYAANTAGVPCATTEQCAAQAAKIGATVEKPKLAGDPANSQFAWLNRINQASIVMLTEEGIVTPELGRKIAGGVRYAIDQGNRPDGKRPTDVLQLEQIMTEKIGPEASLIHSGRSRQDMLATYRLATLRTDVLAMADALNSTRQRLLALADKHIDTLVPAYTNGVQAMPISYAHYLLAFEAAFERDGQRIHELYQRLNLSPMGTAVLANSAYPLNRERLAELLGFDGVRENSLDASQVSTYDVPIEAVNIASNAAIRVGAMVGDIHTQYHQIRPWLLLDEEKTYTSSAMPQKRNPGLLMRAREASSDVAGLAQAVTLRAHNVTTGMTDYKFAFDSLGVFDATREMFSATNAVLDALQVNPQRALEELENEWTTSMELADTLERLHKVPFRIGHSFASLIVEEARDNGLTPKTFPYDHAQKLYAQAAEHYKWSPATLPLDEATFRAALSPRAMVNTRKGTGGPQPEEVKRMLAEAHQTLEVDRQWLKTKRGNLANAQGSLDKAFSSLLPTTP